MIIHNMTRTYVDEVGIYQEVMVDFINNTYAKVYVILF